jgi:hypothetical protein
LSGALLGTTLPVVLNRIATSIAHLAILAPLHLATPHITVAAWPAVLCAALWLANQSLRLVRLRRSSLFEANATAALLYTRDLFALLMLSFGLIVLSAILSLAGVPAAAFAAATLGVLLSRYLFFVSVVPLNMALTFVRRSHA